MEFQQPGRSAISTWHVAEAGWMWRCVHLEVVPGEDPRWKLFLLPPLVQGRNCNSLLRTRQSLPFIFAKPSRLRPSSDCAPMNSLRSAICFSTGGRADSLAFFSACSTLRPRASNVFARRATFLHRDWSPLNSRGWHQGGFLGSLQGCESPSSPSNPWVREQPTPPTIFLGQRFVGGALLLALLCP